MIKTKRKFEMPSIAQLETELLGNSAVSDMELPADTTQDAMRTLTAAAVRRDVSVFARCLINVYGGWPFLSNVERRRVLVALKQIQDNAHDGMTAGELFEMLSSLISKFRDNHISVSFGDKFVRTSLGKPMRDVGENISLPTGVLAEMRGDVAVIAFKTLRMQNHRAEFEEVERKMDDLLEKSSALIVDLRGNGGGDNRLTNELAYRLYGAEMPSGKRVFVRATPDSAIVHKRKVFNPEWVEMNDGSGTICILDADKNPAKPFGSERPGYQKPIYVLTDRGTMSSAEMFITKVRQHPYLKLVGDNTRGGEVFGNVAYCYLPNTKIMFRFGCVYRELEHKNFELNGYAPDIRVPTGGDAYDVAIKDLTATRMKTNSKGHDK